MKSFHCHIPGVAAQYSKCFVSHSLILSLPVHGENEIGGLGLKNRLLSTCILSALSPIVAGDPQECYLIPTGQAQIGC
jgi:hypothetical protein